MAHDVGEPIICTNCGAVFARFRMGTGDGDPLDGERFEWPDGTPCRDGEAQDCRACGGHAVRFYTDPATKQARAAVVP